MFDAVAVHPDVEQLTIGQSVKHDERRPPLAAGDHAGNPGIREMPQTGGRSVAELTRHFHELNVALRAN